MKNYELTVVFHPDLEMNVDPALDKVKQTLDASGAKIINEEHDGKKRLMYPIKKQEFGLYHFFEVELPADAPDKISGSFNISDEILRYLLVRADEHKAKLAAKRANNAETEDAEAENAETNAESHAEETNSKEEA